VAQVRAAGLDARGQRCLVSTGWLAVVEPTVLVVAGSPDSWQRRLQVGLLALGDDAWVSHEAAAALLGLDRSVPGALQFTSARASRCKPPAGYIVHTTTRIGAVDVLTVGGVRCASATRTILDLAAAGATPDRLAAAIDSAIRLHLSAPLVLIERLSELRGRGRHGAVFGSFDAASGAKSTKKTDRSRGLELFGRVGDVGGANHAKDTKAACFQSRRA
jgi:hypothetical protein